MRSSLTSHLVTPIFWYIVHQIIFGVFLQPNAYFTGILQLGVFHAIV